MYRGPEIFYAGEMGAESTQSSLNFHMTMVLSPTDPIRMDEDKNNQILNLTLEIIYLLTGEDYTVVKKTSDDPGTPSSHTERYSRIQIPIKVPPSYSILYEKDNEGKILKLTNKIIRLLTGEGEDYFKRHKDVYEDVTMKDHQPLTSPDASSKRNPAKRCPALLDSRDCAQEQEEDHNVLQHHQDRAHKRVKVEVKDEVEEETVTRADWQSGSSNIDPPETSSSPPNSQDSPEEDQDDQDEPHQDVKVKHVNKETSTRDEWHYRSSIKDPPETSSSPPYSQDSPEEDQDDQDDPHQDVKVKHELDKETLTGDDWHYRSSSKDAPETSPSPHSQDCPEENDPEGDQENEAEVGDLFIIRVDDVEEDEMYVVNDYPEENEEKTFEPIITEPERRYACELCSKCFTRKSHLVEHHKTHTGEKPFICSECGDCFTLKGNLERHKRIHRDDRPYQCLDCGKCFFQKSDLVEHQRIHTGEKPYPCVECGKRFIKKSALVKHQKTHSGEKPFSCPECGKRFSQNTGLVEHQKIHRNERPFSCTYCGKSFTQKGGLAEHQRIHTGEKLFSCSDCGKSFTKNSALIIHQRFHTGEKPFMCSVCEKGFTQKSDLVKHLRIHSGEKPYSCTVCGKSFTQKPDLVEHVRIHTGEKPFTCLECGRSFTHRSNFVKHQVLHKQ